MRRSLVALDPGGGLVLTDADRAEPGAKRDMPHGIRLLVDEAGRFVVTGNTRAGVTLWRFNAGRNTG